jgi:hypothetical protein
MSLDSAQPSAALTSMLRLRGAVPNGMKVNGVRADLWPYCLFHPAIKVKTAGCSCLAAQPWGSVYMNASSPMPGSLAELVNAVLADEISWTAGQERAARPEVAAAVSADDAAVISTMLADLADHRADDKPLQAMRVVRAAAWASGDVESAAISSMRLLTLLHIRLSRVHVGALLCEAVEEHQQAVSLLTDRPAPSWCMGGVHSEFGRLVVDAYTKGGVRGDPRVIEERDRAFRADSPTLAQPEELLRSAADCLAASAAEYPGPVDGDRAAALKARAEALEALEALSVPLKPGEDPATILPEALQATPAEDVDLRAGLVLDLLAYGREVPASCGLRLCDAAEELTGDRDVAALVDTAQAIGRTEPAAGLRLLNQAYTRLSRCSPDLREAAISAELGLIRRLTPASTQHLDAAALKSKAEAEIWTNSQRAATFVAAACGTPEANNELDGLRLVREARACGGDIADSPALDYLEASLAQGEGVNEYRRGNWSKAARWYGEAIRGLLDMDLPDRAHKALEMLLDVTRSADEGDRIPMLAALAPVVGRLEIKAGTKASLLIQEALRNISAANIEVPWNTETLWALRCVAKGARLASALRTGAAAEVSTDTVAASLLARVHELDVAARSGEPDGVAVLDEATLVAYAGHDELFAGDTAAELLRNARRRFDTHISEQLLRPMTMWEAISDVQAQLDDRTVVVDWYQGAMLDGSAALQLLVFSRDQIQASIIPYARAAEPVTLDLDGRAVLTSALAPDTLLRRRSQERPLDEDDLVVADAVEPLEGAMESLFGSFGAEMLEQHRQAGRDHLCLVPHWSLHFDPIHLAGPIGHPLADDWIVTTMPNSALLAARRRYHRGDGIVSVGLESAFASCHKLEPLRDAHAEAIDVAGCFDADPLLEEAATPPTVLDAMSHARFVHLSTHGEQCPEAAAFHRVFLAPDDTSDGSLYAHEILGGDLSSVDLVTLSACESALGRFDVADNIGGLPAALFLTGVRTIIGTLWRVSAAASRVFFGTLYKALAGEKPPLDAFRVAQQATRTAYPLYAQWGAFVFLGDWRWE